MVGAEMPMTSDQVIWSEQNRLHISYDNCTIAANGLDIDVTAGGTIAVTNVISPASTVVIMDDFGGEVKAFVNASQTATGIVSVQPYAFTDLQAVGATGAGLVGTVKIFVYGSDYQKGQSAVGAAAGANAIAAANPMVTVNPAFTTFSNNPIIVRSQYSINGSDTAQIGWVEVATEDGTGGYLWYLKAESETRLRFEDYLEMSMVEGELKTAASPIAGAVGAGIIGTEGLFAAIQARGNVEVGFTAAAGIDSFDAILKNLDTQGAIEENMLFLNRNTALDFDDMLASISGGYAGGTAFGLFENSEEMALNLGFSGFRRGSYDFYKTDWKYLNDASTRGAMTGPASIEGVLVPAGTSTVYDQILGTNIRRPFLHVRYRASQADDRRMKSWLTGSVGGAFTSTLDAMEVNFLSERCLVTQAANNFVLFKGI
tara:strand:+ start:1 stop:1287 length:1287 start_codon:yes stop_codon:yes gene_type:complete